MLPSIYHIKNGDKRMANKIIPKKTLVKATAQTESEKTKVVRGDYTGYFYNQINNLWKEIMLLQQENNELKAQMKGEY